MVYDAIVLGLGGMGSATIYQLALQKQRTLGIEQFTPAHNQGSSHGKTRVIRQAYYEDPSYVPLVLRAYELWYQLERETGLSLLNEVGGLMMGTPDCEVVAGSIRSARLHGLKHEILDAKEIRRRFTPIQPDSDVVGLYERKASIILPEASVKAHLDRAAALGAELHFEEEALGWEPVKAGVRVRTKNGTYEAARLVISPGPWAPDDSLISVYRYKSNGKFSTGLIP